MHDDRICVIHSFILVSYIPIHISIDWKKAHERVLRLGLLPASERAANLNLEKKMEKVRARKSLLVLHDDDDDDDNDDDDDDELAVCESRLLYGIYLLTLSHIRSYGKRLKLIQISKLPCAKRKKTYALVIMPRMKQHYSWSRAMSILVYGSMLTGM